MTRILFLALLGLLVLGTKAASVTDEDAAEMAEFAKALADSDDDLATDISNFDADEDDEAALAHILEEARYMNEAEDDEAGMTVKRSPKPLWLHKIVRATNDHINKWGYRLGSGKKK